MGEKPPGKGGTTVVKVLLRKLRESLISVFPVALIVFVLSLTPLVSLSPREMTVFLLSAAVMVAGIGLFGLGADMAMSPMGEQIGSGLARSRNLPLLLSAAFVMGLCITVAEPDLSVLASQVREVVSDKLLIFSVGCGVGIFLLLSVLRMIFRVNLSNLLFYSYLALFMLTTLVLVYGDADYLALAFDAGGVTTGPVTVPFLMALGVGIAGTLGGKHASENSFGMIALSSVGPMIVVAALGIGAKGGFNYTLPDYSMESKLGAGILRVLLSTGRDVGIAVVLIVLFFTILDRVFLRLPKKTLIRIAVGIAYTFAGLVLFLSAATVGFMPVGFALGRGMADSPALLLVFSFLDFRYEAVREIPFEELVNQFLLMVTDTAGITVHDIGQCPFGNVIASIVVRHLMGCFLLHFLGTVQLHLHLVNVLVDHARGLLHVLEDGLDEGRFFLEGVEPAFQIG